MKQAFSLIRVEIGEMLDLFDRPSLGLRPVTTAAVCPVGECSLGHERRASSFILFTTPVTKSEMARRSTR